MSYGKYATRRRRRVRRRILGVLVVAVFVGALWLTYTDKSRQPDETPVLSAEESVGKPEQPGNSLMPPDEALVAQEVAADPSPQAVDAALDTSPPVAAQGPDAIPELPSVAALPQPAPASANSTAPPEPARTTVLAPAAVNEGSGYRLQLAAVHSEAAAQQAWTRIKGEQKDLLGAIGGAWPRADLGERGIFYRVQAGPIDDAVKARRMCDELKRRRVACIIVR
jgi:cell division septation protein DedD